MNPTMSSIMTQNLEIKEELLETLDKLIKHSQKEAHILKHALDQFKENGRSEQVKEEPDPTPPLSRDTIVAAETLLRMKEQLTRSLRQVTTPHPPPEDRALPAAKRPRIDLGPEFSGPPASTPPPQPSSTPMVLVPIPADQVRELILNGGTIPPMSLLSALQLSQVSSEQLIAPAAPRSSPPAPTTPEPSSPTSPTLSPTISSSILRFCERRSARDSVDVFHYLPADAKSSPFPTSKSNHYRQFLDDITATKVKIPKLPKSYEALPKLSPVMNERTVYTPFQTDRLEQSFADNPFLSKEQREEMSKELHIHPGRIKVWYQNRRARKRREDVLKEKIETAARTGSTTVGAE